MVEGIMVMGLLTCGTNPAKAQERFTMMRNTLSEQRKNISLSYSNPELNGFSF